MSVYIASLNSGSNGNCYYIGNDTEAVLIDAGISCKETEKRMRRLRLPLEKIKAIFITHEHIDHIKGVEVLSNRYNLPVYITETTLGNCYSKTLTNYMSTFSAYKPVTIGELVITAFPKLHDAADPHSFVVDCNAVRIGIFTDIGAPCSHVTHHFSTCHAAFLESNYDEDMLAKGRYPYHLKKRISGDYGHLSNKQALELFLAHKPSFMTHLLLSHLSRDNNNPELAQQVFLPHAGDTHVAVAPRDNESPIYKITGQPTVKTATAPPLVQASLF